MNEPLNDTEECRRAEAVCEHAAMAENEDPEGPEPEQDEDSAEDMDHGELVDLSRFYASTIKPLQEYLDGQNAQIRKMLTGMAAAQMRPTLPRIVVENPLLRMSTVAETLRKQVADMTGFNDTIRQALQPMHDFYPAQWQNVFASLAEVTRRLYPENLRDAAPRIRDPCHVPPQAANRPVLRPGRRQHGHPADVPGRSGRTWPGAGPLRPDRRSRHHRG
jgi:hypothetical protein